MVHLEFHLYSFIIALILTAVIIVPVLHFLIVGWSYKSNDVLNSLSASAKKKYLALYQKRECSNDEAQQEFEVYYWKWYGKRHLISATALVAITAFLGSYFSGEAALNWILHNKEYISPPKIAVAGFLGGYIFVAWDFIDRNARRDLSSSDIYRGALRLVSAIAIGWAFSKLVTPALGPFVAFAVGVFPLPTVQIILRRALNKQLQIDNASDTSQDMPTNLSGINNDIADRLRDADILTITQLAYSDPIQLTMHTNLCFTFINDIVSQALAWIYLGEKLNTLRPLGLRGACEISDFMGSLKEGDTQEEKETAAKQMQQYAIVTGIEITLLENCFEQISLDPYNEFLADAYNP